MSPLSIAQDLSPPRLTEYTGTGPASLVRAAGLPPFSPHPFLDASSRPVPDLLVECCRPGPAYRWNAAGLAPPPRWTASGLALSSWRNASGPETFPLGELIRWAPAATSRVVTLAFSPQSRPASVPAVSTSFRAQNCGGSGVVGVETWDKWERTGGPLIRRGPIRAPGKSK